MMVDAGGLTRQNWKKGFQTFDLSPENLFLRVERACGYNDPSEQPLAPPRRQLHSDGAETRHVIFKNKLTWNKVGAV